VKALARRVKFAAASVRKHLPGIATAFDAQYIIVLFNLRKK
jgi:hypothetical protein